MTALVQGVTGLSTLRLDGNQDRIGTRFLSSKKLRFAALGENSFVTLLPIIPRIYYCLLVIIVELIMATSTHSYNESDEALKQLQSTREI